jgi:hypothetical protein
MSILPLITRHTQCGVLAIWIMTYIYRWVKKQSRFPREAQENAKTKQTRPSD